MVNDTRAVPIGAELVERDGAVAGDERRAVVDRKAFGALRNPSAELGIAGESA